MKLLLQILLHILLFPFFVIWYALKLCFRAYKYFFGYKTAGNDGYGFEYTCAEILMERGFYSVNVTKASGDQGVDIIACKGGDEYAVQCKLYSRPVGNKAVQEAYAGMGYYKCSRAAVMTNSTFTKGAIDLAKSLNVDLWDNTPTTTDRRRSPVVFWFSLFVALMIVAVMAVEGIDQEKQIAVLAGWLGFVVLYIILDPFIKLVVRCIKTLMGSSSASHDGDGEDDGDDQDYDDDEEYDDCDEEYDDDDDDVDET